MGGSEGVRKRAQTPTMSPARTHTPCSACGRARRAVLTHPHADAPVQSAGVRRARARARGWGTRAPAVISSRLAFSIESWPDSCATCLSYTSAFSALPVCCARMACAFCALRGEGRPRADSSAARERPRRACRPPPAPPTTTHTATHAPEPAAQPAAPPSGCALATAPPRSPSTRRCPSWAKLLSNSRGSRHPGQS